MHKVYLSVIVPTFNRAEELDQCLNFLYEQNLAQESFEVIVVNDGSTDTTKELLSIWEEKWSNLHVIHQKNAGQGCARNRGIGEARGEVILFIGDDIYATKNFLFEHVQFHQENPQANKACLGLTQWYPQKMVTPFMEWLTNGGPQFAYHLLKAGEVANFWFFYTSNLSLKKSLLNTHSFDTDFKSYGWEDIELGYRLEEEGLKLIYKPSALAYHDHYADESSLKKRMINVGKSALVFQEKQPKVTVVPRGIKKLILFCATRTPFLWLSKPFQRLHWTLLSKRYFLDGLSSI